MKKLFTKCIVMLLSLCMLWSFVACGGDTIPDGEDTTNLYIYAAEKGYGVNMLKALCAEFEKRNEGVKVHFKSTSLESQITNSFELGGKKNNYDIYFTCTGNMYTFLNNYSFSGYSESLYDLTEIYQTVLPGENTTIEEKMYPYFRDYFNTGTEEDPKYYALSWATGSMGMCYNVDVVKAALGENYELPRTTNELKEFATKLKTAGTTPFVFPGGSDYFMFSMLPVWWAQYEGLEEFNHFLDGKAYDEIQEDYVYSSKIYEQTGRLKALEAMYDLVNYDGGLVLKTANDYDNNNFRTLQTRFVRKESKYAMYPNGDWFEQESVLSGDSEIAMMKSPVISSIIDRLKTVNNDTELREVISYVDGDITTLSKTIVDGTYIEYDKEKQVHKVMVDGTIVEYTQEEFDKIYLKDDINEVRTARNMLATSHGLGHTCWVPAYTNAPTLVKKFLLFMYSEEGAKIYKENCAGGFLPMSCDYSDIELSTFEKSVYDLTKNIVAVGTMSKSPIFNAGGAQVWDLTNAKPDAAFSLPTTSNYYATAKEFYERSFKSSTQWDNILIKAGIN